MFGQNCPHDLVMEWTRPVFLLIKRERASWDHHSAWALLWSAIKMTGGMPKRSVRRLNVLRCDTYRKGQSAARYPEFSSNTGAIGEITNSACQWDARTVDGVRNSTTAGQKDICGTISWGIRKTFKPAQSVVPYDVWRSALGVSRYW